MKLNLYKLLFLIPFFLNSCQCNISAQQTETELEIILGEQEPNEINCLINGFNAANLFYYYQKDNEQLNEAIRNLEIQHVRFPGGTTANFYHPFEKGYGFRTQELELVKGSFVYKNINKSIQYEQKQIENDSISRNFLYDFINFAETHKLKVLYVANLFTGNEKEILFTLSTMIDSGIEIIGVELGNEYYLQAYKSKFPNVEAYISRAKEIASVISKKYPGIKIGVVAAPHSSFKDMKAKQSERMDNWNKKLAGENFYNTIITHIYAAPKKCLKFTDEKEIFNCAIENNAKFINERLTESFFYYESLFGKERKIWLTEWNLHGVFEYFGNTMLQAIYYVDFITALFEYSNVALANCHNLLATGDGYNAIASNKTCVSKKAIYFASELLNPVFLENTYRISVSISDTNIENLINCQAFLNKKKNEIYLIVTNKKDTSVKLSALQIPGNKKIAGITTSMLYANQLFEDVKISIMDEKLITKKNKEIKSLYNVPGFFFKPYSISMIRIDLSM